LKGLRGELEKSIAAGKARLVLYFKSAAVDKVYGKYEGPITKDIFKTKLKCKAFPKGKYYFPQMFIWMIKNIYNPYHLSGRTISFYGSARGSLIPFRSPGGLYAGTGKRSKQRSILINSEILPSRKAVAAAIFRLSKAARCWLLQVRLRIVFIW
jgi:hypothetical protein